MQRLRETRELGRAARPAPSQALERDVPREHELEVRQRQRAQRAHRGSVEPEEVPGRQRRERVEERRQDVLASALDAMEEALVVQAGVVHVHVRALEPEQRQRARQRVARELAQAEDAQLLEVGEHAEQHRHRVRHLQEERAGRAAQTRFGERADERRSAQGARERTRTERLVPGQIEREREALVVLAPGEASGSDLVHDHRRAAHGLLGVRRGHVAVVRAPRPRVALAHARHGCAARLVAAVDDQHEAGELAGARTQRRRQRRRERARAAEQRDARRHGRCPVKKSRTPSHTSSTSRSSSSGETGSESTVRASASATGKSPAR